MRSASSYSPSHLLALAAFMVAIIAETGRVPVDNPDTHLELTMIHEGMILEYSGRYLALMEWAHYMKQMVLFTLAMDIFLPGGNCADDAVPARWPWHAASMRSRCSACAS